MPSSAEAPDALVDTSAAVALVVSDHEHHRATADALAGRRLGLCGHAAFETFSVLTRLPAPARRTPAAVSRLLRANFPATRFLSSQATEDLFGRLVSLGLSGGSAYDALVAAAAAEQGTRLVTRDRRALPTYLALEADVELLG